MFVLYGERWEKSRVVRRNGGTPSIPVSAAASTFKARHATKTSMRNSRVSKVHGVAESNFLSGAHAGATGAASGPVVDRHRPAGAARRPEDRSARPIEGQVANYVQLQSARPMKIEREFANMVGGADPGGLGYSDVDVPAISVRIRLGTRKFFATEQETAKQTEKHQKPNPKFIASPFTIKTLQNCSNIAATL